jgi:hypothetical protein
MSATASYRIAAILFVLFAAGHTVGFLTLTPPTAEALAVRDAMNKVHFEVGGASFSYGGFYRGFGLSITEYLIFSAFLAWHLGKTAAAYPAAVGMLGWIFFAVQIAGLALSLKYFSLPPAILSALVAICLGWAAWSVCNRQP